MHVLITADTVGGVWTYARELVTGLIRRGIRVTLVSMGAIPSAAETAWLEPLSGLDYRPTAFRLEWMQDAETDIEQSSHYLENLVREVRPDLLHLNQYCYGSLATSVPRLVVAHSDVVSWWAAVHGHEPPESVWINWYRDIVLRGLRGSDVVVAPSHWMLKQIQKYYGNPERASVIHNGCDPGYFDAESAKENCVLAVGRAWDPAKGIGTLLERTHQVPVWIAGPDQEPGSSGTAALATTGQVAFLGHQRRNRLLSLFARAGTYAATSIYEPFGLAPVEAALSRCALVASDIPTFHEIWGDAPHYFRPSDADDLARAIRVVTGDKTLRGRIAERVYERAQEKYSAERMVNDYEALYHAVAAGVKV